MATQRKRPPSQTMQKIRVSDADHAYLCDILLRHPYLPSITSALAFALEQSRKYEAEHNNK